MDTEQHNKNMEKYRNYAELFPRLGDAVEKEFYLEAIFIAYAIVEDRTESLLRHLGKWEEYAAKCAAEDKTPTISGKVSRIRREAKKVHSPAHPFFSDDLLSQFMVWKNARNKKIHELMTQPFSTAELKELAETGRYLARTISNRTESVKRAIKKAERAEKN